MERHKTTAEQLGKLAAESEFIDEIPCGSDPEGAIKWMTAVVAKGLTRVSAEVIEYGAAVGPGPSRFGAASQRIDRVLQQARILGGREGYIHVTCARFGNTVVILSDDDRHYDWLIPAIRQRIREELANLQIEIDPEKTQSVNLDGGGKIRMLGFELRCVVDPQGRRQVHFERVEETSRRECARPRLGLLGVLNPGGRVLRRLKTNGKFLLPVAHLADRALDWSRLRRQLASQDRIGSLFRALMREWRWLAPLLALQGALAWIYFCGGCLKGTVSYQGKPVKEGWVFLFSPEAVHLCPDTRRRVGVIEKGLYRLSGVDPGPYSVRVVAPDPNARGKTIVTRQRLIVDVDYLFNTHDLDLDVMGPAIK